MYRKIKKDNYVFRRETIIRFEKGMYNPSLKLAVDIARVFNKTVEEVFIFEEETTIHNFME